MKVAILLIVDFCRCRDSLGLADKHHTERQGGRFGDTYRPGACYIFVRADCSCSELAAVDGFVQQSSWKAGVGDHLSDGNGAGSSRGFAPNNVGS
jgi:hypothetical protein